MNYQEQKELLINKERILQSEIRQILSSYKPQQKRELLEKQYNLTRIRGKLAYIRPENLLDSKYREQQMNWFDLHVKNLLPQDCPIVFHGTPIFNVEKILRSGRICSGKDLWTIRTSGNLSNQVSVTTKDSLKLTSTCYSGLHAYKSYLPAGGVFVIWAQDQKEFKQAIEHKHIQNVNFKEHPERLHSIITTPENLSRVKSWVKKYGHKVPVYDYDIFVRKLRQKLASCLTSHFGLCNSR